jgi:Cu+-exporting ATPase
VATGTAARAGILFRDASVLETASKVDHVVFDKTGTLSEGRFVVRDVRIVPGAAHAPPTEDALLALAAALEQDSEHPLGRAIVAKARETRETRETRERILRLPEVRGRANRPGRGVEGESDGLHVQVGNVALCGLPEEDGARELMARVEAEGRTVVQVRVEGVLVGILGLEDAPRPEARETVAALNALGIGVSLLSGDREAAVAALARRTGIHAFVAQALPENKIDLIEGMRREARVVAMVGDGVNDAPALAAADLGIAVSGASGIAMDAAGITLLRPDLRDVLRALDMARACRRIIRQNLIWAFGYNVLAIPLAAGLLYPMWGLRLSPMVAGAAMALSSVSVVANSLRLRRLARRQRGPSIPAGSPTPAQADLDSGRR